jgi:hypothetical protein
MCFSPQADFTAGAVVAGVGVQTLRRVHVRRELIVGALPLLLGIHQLVEGLVWLAFAASSPRDRGTPPGDVRRFCPRDPPRPGALRFTLLEPERRRARWMWPLVGLGLLLGVYLLWQVIAYSVGAQLQARCIDYTTHTPNDLLIGVLYVAVTCGPALISSRRYLRWFGVVSLVGVIAAALVRVGELTSLWCVYVALVSVLILEHFRRQRAFEAAPSRSVARPEPGPT